MEHVSSVLNWYVLAVIHDCLTLNKKLHLYSVDCINIMKHTMYKHAFELYLGYRKWSTLSRFKK